MNVVIDPTIQRISIDGRDVDVAFQVAPEISRITWDGSAGTIEYRAPQPFSDAAFVQPFLDLFNTEVARLDMAAQAAAKVEEVIAALNAFPDAQKIDLAEAALVEIAKTPAPNSDPNLKGATG